MTVQNAIDAEIPDVDLAAGFTDGERAVTGFGMLAATVAQSTFRFARMLDLTGGVYRIKLAMRDAGAVFIGSNAVTLKRVAAVEAGLDEVQVDTFVEQGRYRLEVVLANLTTGSTSCYFVLSIFKGTRLVYASAAAGWKWDTVAVPDALLPVGGDERKLLPLFPVSPNWEQGVTERLSWRTEVFTSETSIEQRRSWLLRPRRTFEASFLRAGANRQKLAQFIPGVGRGKFLVPLWHEQYKIPDPLGASRKLVSFPVGSLQWREFYAGELALLSNGLVSEVVGIQFNNLDNDQILLDGFPVNEWPVGTRITPLAVVRFDELPEVSNITDRASSSTMRFALEYTQQGVVPSWGSDTPLWRFRVNRQQPMDLDFTRQTFEMDVGTSVRDVTDPGRRGRVGVRASLRLFGREALWAYRAFLAQARGQSQRFWFPSGTHDIEPYGATSGSILYGVLTGFSDVFATQQDSHTVIGIYFNDGREPIYRTIVDYGKATVNLSGVGDIGWGERWGRAWGGTGQSVEVDAYTLDGSLPTIQRSEIERISFVMPARFAQDTFEMLHHTDNSKVTSTSVSVISSDLDGMPPITTELEL